MTADAGYPVSLRCPRILSRPTTLLAASSSQPPNPNLGNAQYLIPTTAHAEALRIALITGAAVPARDWYGLSLWTVLAIVAAARTFRWD